LPVPKSFSLLPIFLNCSWNSQQADLAAAEKLINDCAKRPDLPQAAQAV
jgi:hypothetical protein